MYMIKPLAAVVAVFFAVASAAPVANPNPQDDVSTDAAAVHHGTATYYLQGGVAGSCGNKHQDSDLIVALAPSFMPQSCGRSIKATHAGKSVTVKVQDTCPGCGTNHIDLSKGAFSKLAPLSAGNINVDWHFV